MWSVKARFTWGDKVFTFPFEHEAITFQEIILMCRECISAHIPEKIDESRTEKVSD